MSELKAMKFFEAVPTSKEGFYQPGAFVDGYLKSEADKVIAELKNEIEVQKRLRDMALASVPNVLKVMKIIQHDKYKRCLGIAAVCFEKSYSTTLVKYDEKSGLLRNFYDWWGKILAETCREIQGGEVMNRPELIFCECCGERKPWSTLYHGLQSRGNLMAVCPACKEYLERKDKEAK